MWGLKYPWNESALQRPRWCWSFPFPYPTAAERVEMEERESEAVSKPGGRTPPRARMSGGRPRPRACLLVGPSGRAREFNGRHTTKSDACKSEAWERVEAEGEREEPDSNKADSKFFVYTEFSLFLTEPSPVSHLRTVELVVWTRHGRAVLLVRPVGAVLRGNY